MDESKKTWILRGNPKFEVKLKESEKINIQSKFEPMVEEFKKRY